MQENDIIKLYEKERAYQQKVFGDYTSDESLSLASFLLFLKEYVDKAMKNYSGLWSKDLPPWLKTCKEYENNEVAPTKSYAEIIKIMALAGAALETYGIFDVDKWRENPDEDSKKWKENIKGE